MAYRSYQRHRTSYRLRVAVERAEGTPRAVRFDCSSLYHRTRAENGACRGGLASVAEFLTTPSKAL